MLMSWLAETVLRIRSRLPAFFFMLSGLVDTRKLSAPIFLAAASLLGEVEMAVTVLPIALASMTPIWPEYLTGSGYFTNVVLRGD